MGECFHDILHVTHKIIEFSYGFSFATIEAQGGIPGFDKIELFPQDTSCDPNQSVAAANKLINLGVAGVVGAYCSSSTIPASEVLSEEDIPMLICFKITLKAFFIYLPSFIFRSLNLEFYAKVGIASHVCPSKSRPAFFLFTPPHCLKKKFVFDS